MIPNLAVPGKGGAGSGGKLPTAEQALEEFKKTIVSVKAKHQTAQPVATIHTDTHHPILSTKEKLQNLRTQLQAEKEQHTFFTALDDLLSTLTDLEVPNQIQCQHSASSVITASTDCDKTAAAPVSSSGGAGTTTESVVPSKDEEEVKHQAEDNKPTTTKNDQPTDSAPTPTFVKAGGKRNIRVKRNDSDDEKKGEEENNTKPPTFGARKPKQIRKKPVQIDEEDDESKPDETPAPQAPTTTFGFKKRQRQTRKKTVELSDDDEQKSDDDGGAVIRRHHNEKVGQKPTMPRWRRALEQDQQENSSPDEDEEQTPVFQRRKSSTTRGGTNTFQTRKRKDKESQPEAPDSKKQATQQKPRQPPPSVQDIHSWLAKWNKQYPTSYWKHTSLQTVTHLVQLISEHEMNTTWNPLCTECNEVTQLTSWQHSAVTHAPAPVDNTSPPAQQTYIRKQILAECGVPHIVKALQERRRTHKGEDEVDNVALLKAQPEHVQQLVANFHSLCEEYSLRDEAMQPIRSYLGFPAQEEEQDPEIEGSLLSLL
eukprot:TRINITY_DN67689_c12_g10_i1.p1 TRINITY_DN67689_c12_g10~~TRINITY_DN67689_c12_g10_i1.p1  ORF type:complete len:539 (+),score=105.70 TRINITY_DN67689_c12_g10_i1:44-1660(+)